MTTLASEPAVQTMQIVKHEQVDAPIDVVFQALLDELGPESQMPDGTSLKLKLEPWPGGRWFRDVGNNTGHLWGHVQVIKPPTLLEICGPLFISFPATNHLQYRLFPQGNDRTKLTLTHRSFGYMPKDFVKGVEEGWDYGLKRIAEIAKRKTQR